MVDPFEILTRMREKEGTVIFWLGALLARGNVSELVLRRALRALRLLLDENFAIVERDTLPAIAAACPGLEGYVLARPNTNHQLRASLIAVEHAVKRGWLDAVQAFHVFEDSYCTHAHLEMVIIAQARGAVDPAAWSHASPT